MQNILIFILSVIAATFYFLPAIVAMARRHVNVVPIFLTNLYLGFTFIGWAVAAIWSFSSNVYPAAAPTIDTHSLYMNKPVETSKKGMGVLHYVLIVAAVLLAAVVVLFIVAPQPVNHPTAEAPTVKAGVPVPADEMFSDAPAAADTK